METIADTSSWSNAVLNAEGGAGLATKIVTKFDFNPIGTRPAEGTIIFARLHLSPTHRISLYLEGPGVPVTVFEGERVDGSPDWRQMPLKSATKINAWTRYEIEADIAAKHVVVRTDGAVAADFAMAGKTFSEYSVELGLSSLIAVPFAAKFDNITLDVD